jgi:hypothetical protein
VAGIQQFVFCSISLRANLGRGHFDDAAVDISMPLLGLAHANVLHILLNPLLV